MRAVHRKVRRSHQVRSEAGWTGGLVKMGELTYRHLLVFVATHFFLLGTEALCPPSWMTYQAHCYGMVAVPRSWMEAEVECQTLGQHGHLASLLSEAEHAAVSNYIKNNFPDVDRAWIALHDPRKTRNWAWADSSPFFYQSWSAGQPNNKGGREFCVLISKNQGFRKWSDADCKLTLPSVCKTKL